VEKLSQRPLSVSLWQSLWHFARRGIQHWKSWKKGLVQTEKVGRVRTSASRRGLSVAEQWSTSGAHLGTRFDRLAIYSPNPMKINQEML